MLGVRGGDACHGVRLFVAYRLTGNTHVHGKFAAQARAIAADIRNDLLQLLRIVEWRSDTTPWDGDVHFV